jgi:hypothetical protein
MPLSRGGGICAHDHNEMQVHNISASGKTLIVKLARYYTNPIKVYIILLKLVINKDNSINWSNQLHWLNFLQLKLATKAGVYCLFQISCHNKKNK